MRKITRIEDLQKLIHQHGIGKITRNRKEMTLLHIVCFNREDVIHDPKMIDYVVDDCGVDINARDVLGNTALIYACRSRIQPYVTRLLEKGAKLNIADNDGKCAIWYAMVGFGSKKIRYEMAKQLLSFGAKWAKNNTFRYIATMKPIVQARINTRNASIAVLALKNIYSKDVLSLIARAVWQTNKNSEWQMEKIYMDESIARRAQAHTPKVASHDFNAKGRLFVNDQDTESFVGSVEYMPKHLCQIDCALDTNGWVFCIERMVTNDFKPVFGAFHAGGHYSFAEIEEPKDGETMENTLILLVISNFWHILHPDCFDGGLPAEGEPVKVSWQVELIPMYH